jgi:hypothetical protein
VQEDLQEGYGLGQQWFVPKKKNKVVLKTSHVQTNHPPRQSTKLAKDGVPVMEKATRRV